MFYILPAMGYKNAINSVNDKCLVHFRCMNPASQNKTKKKNGWNVLLIIYYFVIIVINDATDLYVYTHRHTHSITNTNTLR